MFDGVTFGYVEGKLIYSTPLDVCLALSSYVTKYLSLVSIWTLELLL